MGVVGVIYAIALFFFVLTIDLPPEAQTYPMGLIIALAGVNTIFFGQCLFRMIRGRLGVVHDLGETFKGFFAGQFFFILGGAALYIALMGVIGYYAATLIYLVGTLLCLRVPRLHAALTVATLVVLIGVVFSFFLKVPLPVGMLFE